MSLSIFKSLNNINNYNIKYYEFDIIISGGGVAGCCCCVVVSVCCCVAVFVLVFVMGALWLWGARAFPSAACAQSTSARSGLGSPPATPPPTVLRTRSQTHTCARSRILPPLPQTNSKRRERRPGGGQRRRQAARMGPCVSSSSEGGGERDWEKE